MSLWVLVGPYKTICNSMGPLGSLLVLKGAYPTLWVVMSSYRFLCYVMNFNESLCVLMGPCWSF